MGTYFSPISVGPFIGANNLTTSIWYDNHEDSYATFSSGVAVVSDGIDMNNAYGAVPYTRDWGIDPWTLFIRVRVSSVNKGFFELTRNGATNTDWGLISYTTAGYYIWFYFVNGTSFGGWNSAGWGTLSTGTDYVIALTHTGGTPTSVQSTIQARTKVYVDGVNVTMGTGGSGALHNSSGKVYVGARNYPFADPISYFSVQEVALTAKQVVRTTKKIQQLFL